MIRLYPILCTLIFVFSANIQAAESKKVLIIASNVTDMGDAEKHDARNNLWEVAPPYHVFVSHGYEVDFASPKGGKLEFMMDAIGISSYTIRYDGFLDKANHSIVSAKVDPNDYWAVYIGGGYGPLFDVAADPESLTIISKVYQAGGIIGSSGHGAGAFANARLANGEFLVNGKRIAGFPDSTEKTKSWAKQGSLLPFMVESRLRKNGAIAQNKQTVKDKHDVIIDDRLVSTMFLPSAALVAKEMIQLKQQ